MSPKTPTNQTPRHPGTIVYVDGNTQQELESQPIDQVPEELRFAPSSEGLLVPVVRVVAHTHGNRRTLREYGPDGELLRSTVQLKSP